MTACRVCPRECGVNREGEDGRGFCRSGALPKLARAALHYGEEPCISGEKGSGTIFFSGCCLGCIFCQNSLISGGERFGKTVTMQRLADIFRELEDKGAENINLVSPTHFVPQILQALDIYRPCIPIVYNTGGYEKVETLRMLDGYIDIYLPDIKYADSQLGQKFSGVPDYPETAFAAVEEMLRQTGNICLNERGIATKGTLIRHLVLPLHTKDSMAVLDEICNRFGTEVWVSLMFQYTPMKQFEAYPELNRGLTERECNRVEAHLQALGFTNGYTQLLESLGKKYIPNFDLSGV